MKPVKEVINLCRQIAKKQRLKIEYGDWYWSRAYDNTLLAMDYGFKPSEQEYMGVFKIWTEKDCFEFLVEKGWNDIVIEIKPYLGEIKCFAERGEVEKGHEHEVAGEAKTPLEACLKVVLAVFEEG